MVWKIASIWPGAVRQTGSERPRNEPVLAICRIAIRLMLHHLCAVNHPYSGDHCRVSFKSLRPVMWWHFRLLYASRVCIVVRLPCGSK